ncbi:hypothetical protein A5682_06430 [Mycobacterium mantenii]|uniref:DUF4190 domain-containing protein n=1 Tax=Mycobacterium mantenii TaxID=560555 RepID=UPI000800E357|nr:DUF4190 domain-containing protein [Mycobacterium mantenii]OBH72427.1 hypothetical protein A5682_06430 [Mycobacterium mantenii]
MTTPGGGFGEGAHDDDADSSPAASGAAGPPEPTAPWEPPGTPPAGEAAPPTYPPPGYPYPPPAAPPPGYEQPPGYGGPAYPPPPPYGGPPTYGPPPYPGGYYPAPDYHSGYGPAGQPPAGTNPLAVASLIASFTGLLCFVGSIAAMVLGAIALDQIKRTRQDGFGLAVAGIVIGIALLVVDVVVVLFALHTH